MKKPLAVLITAFSLSLGLTPAFTGISGNLIIEAEAHQGRTDANGGHHDYKNKSGLGSYHYHCGGNPAHLHPNGVCPYAGGSSGNSGSAGGSSSKNPSSSGNQNQTETAAAQVSTGWQKDDHGWWYRLSADTYYADGIASTLGDKKQFDGNQCLVDALNRDASNVNEEGVQSTWTQVREKYSATVDSEIKELNQKKDKK